jgi:HEAT repeats
VIERNPEDRLDLKALLDTPPWDWPGDAGRMFWRILVDPRAEASERLVAAELAGDFTVINDDLADALLTIASSADEPEQLRARAAISLGPVLEQADTDGFEDPDDVPITEHTFRTIKESLEKLYLGNSTPKEVRRRCLEASVRAPQIWHQGAIRQAYSSGDKEWMLTAVFSMRWVRGFDDQILLALKSDDPAIKYEAVIAAGNWGLNAAWSSIIEFLNDGHSPKPLLLAAIGAVGSIRPDEALEVLADLADSDDEEIFEAVEEALAPADVVSDEEDGEEDKWVN